MNREAVSGGASGDHDNGYVEADYRDYDEAMAAARAQNKPLLLDFTGYGLV